jgi:hypothetical protein
MYVRVFSGRIRGDSIKIVTSHCETSLIPAFKETAGFVRAELWNVPQHDDSSAVDSRVVSYWDSVEAANKAMESRPVWESLFEILPYLTGDPEVETLVVGGQ